MKNINLYWFKFIGGYGNFGDDLSVFIISRLTNRPINHIVIPATGSDYIKRCYKLLRYGNTRNAAIKQLPTLIKQYFCKDFITAIGSIVEHINCSKCKIWGSGIISMDAKINPAQFYAVRGKYTQKRLNELNLPVPNTIGDPALLLPLVYPAQKTNKYKLGIIPHVSQYKEIVGHIKSKKYLVIDLTKPIEQVIEEINSCNCIASTSLHGIIVSQAYGVPCIWYTYKKLKLVGDDIKFYDYFSSVGIEEYKPFELNIESFDPLDAISKVEKNENISTIKNDLHEIQANLIKAAPFDVVEKYKVK